MLIVIDTSGSMSGTPEIIAKALTLQAEKTAHAEKRACYLYAFGGQGQRIEHDLKIYSRWYSKITRVFGAILLVVGMILKPLSMLLND